MSMLSNATSEADVGLLPIRPLGLICLTLGYLRD
jgi:hypothetical protein